MAANNGQDHQRPLNPHHSYPPQGQPQFQQPQQPFTYSQPYPPLQPPLNPALNDDQIAQLQDFGRHNESNFGPQVEENAQNGRARNGESPLDIDTHVPPVSGVAMPHQQLNLQNFPPPTPRGSMDMTPDSATPGDKSKPKPKASRACDECRRKKTKCNNNMGVNGQYITCDGCQKNNQVCHYTREQQKRGPNKGYIKDLADQTEVLKRRVDSMEQGNVRGSFDVGDLFASPDDPTMSAKRNYSRTSFSAAELGSQGFANMNYTPTSSAARLRYSVAIPPDQQVLQSVNSEDYYDEGMQRAAKRLKMDDPQLQTIAIDSNDLSKYYATIHPDFPLLPDASDVAISIIQQATPELQHAFLGAIDLLPGPLNNASISKSRIGTEVAMVASLQAAYKEDMNTTTNMVTYIWTCVLLIIHTECAMDMYRVGSITSPPILVRQYMQVIKKLRSDLSKAQRAAGDTQGLDAATLEDVVMRTFCFASLQEKLVLIATHNYDLSDQEIRPEPEDIATVNGLSPAHRYLASATKLLAFSLPNLVNPKDIAARTNKNIILDLLKLEAIRVQLDYSSATFCQQLTDFFELLLVRTQRLAMPLDVLTPVAKLCEKLGTPAVTYAPLEIHFYTTCVFTILEVLALPTDFAIEYAAPVAVTALKTIRGALQEKAVAFSAARSPTEINYWGVYNGKPIIKKHWAQVLLLHLEKAEQKGWYNENSAKLASLGGTMGVRGLPKDVTGNFGQLLDYGYLTILSEYAARQEQEELVGGGGGVAEAGIGAGGLGGSGGMLQGNGEAASASTAVETAAAANAAVEEGGH